MASPTRSQPSSVRTSAAPLGSLQFQPIKLSTKAQNPTSSRKNPGCGPDTRTETSLKNVPPGTLSPPVSQVPLAACTAIAQYDGTARVSDDEGLAHVVRDELEDRTTYMNRPDVVARSVGGNGEEPLVRNIRPRLFNRVVVVTEEGSGQVALSSPGRHRSASADTDRDRSVALISLMHKHDHQDKDRFQK